MFILFGFGKQTVKDHGDCLAGTCPRCHNQVTLRHLQLTTWFTLFFLPVIPYKRARVLICPICRWSRDVPKAAVPLTEEMATITTQWRAGALSDADYAARVDAYWSFQSMPASAPSAEQDQSLGPDSEHDLGPDR
jgi:hypothetical protein